MKDVKQWTGRITFWLGFHVADLDQGHWKKSTNQANRERHSMRALRMIVGNVPDLPDPDQTTALSGTKTKFPIQSLLKAPT